MREIHEVENKKIKEIKEIAKSFSQVFTEAEIALVIKEIEANKKLAHKEWLNTIDPFPSM